MKSITIRSILTSALFAASSAPAFAHVGEGHLHSFADGFGHPWHGLDHVLAMTAVGLWAAAAGGRRLWMLPAAFVSAMAAGAWLGFAGFQVGGVETWVALSVPALGLLPLFWRRPVPVQAALAVALFALGHGYVHAAEASGVNGMAAYAFGFLAATVALHALGMTAGLCGPRMLRAVRAAFALVCTLAGMALLAGA